MLQKTAKFVIVLMSFLFMYVAQAQDTAATIQTDTSRYTLKTSDGKTVLIGTPVSIKPLSTMDTIKLFFTTLYEKYPVWCWIAGIFILVSLFRLIRRAFN